MAEYRELKNRTRISSTLDNEIYKQLKQYADKSDIPITKILDRAVEMYLKNVKSIGWIINVLRVCIINIGSFFYLNNFLGLPLVGGLFDFSGVYGA